MTSWLAVTLELEAGAAEALSDALLEAGAQSVALESGRLSAILAADTDAGALILAAARAAGVAAPRFHVEPVHDRDWVRASQAQFSPAAFGRLWIGASWHEPPASDATVVRIDPGMAFGTGSHPTTRLVLAWLEQNVRGGERLLDYGCGSGILAIAAARLGAGPVDAVDTDAQAVEAAAANARANGVALRARLPEDLSPSQYDLVVSNILLQPLVLLAPLLAARAAPGGRMALAGVLDSQAEELVRAYTPWFDAAPVSREDGWTLVSGVRR
jgi:ribosomal protein L11 methyltransferase